MHDPSPENRRMPINHDDPTFRSRHAAICTKLGQDLKAARADDERVRALFVAAVAEYMQVAREAGAGPTEHPGELGCAETLRDGGGSEIPSPFDIAEATDDECERWTDMLADAADY
jgi:hypothetical protein